MIYQGFDPVDELVWRAKRYAVMYGEPGCMVWDPNGTMTIITNGFSIYHSPKERLLKVWYRDDEVSDNIAIENKDGKTTKSNARLVGPALEWLRRHMVLDDMAAV